MYMATLMITLGGNEKLRYIFFILPLRVLWQFLLFYKANLFIFTALY
jgi:hypothetical protein